MLTKFFRKLFSRLESEPKVRGPDGNVQTLSEYILGIIRAAQKIVQEDSLQEEDIKDYDKFIDNTFEAMLSEVDSSDSNDESTAVIQGVVDKLIDEVCSSPKLKMPEMESSSVSTFHEEPQNVASETMNDADNKIEQAKNILENGITSAENIEMKNVVIEDGTNDAKDITKTEISNVSEEFREIEEIAVEKVEKISPDISNDELEKIAEKFVENICNDAKNEFFVEEENKANEKTDSIKDSDEGIDKDIKNQDKEETNEEDNGQIDKEEEEEASENKIQNHSAKVHPEDSKPAVANQEDITQTESLPTEGKSGKDQKYDVTKDKIKPKRRSRGIRNSFRRMFSCFSTKSSQLE
ncbi:Hypothetical predicted protein [Mytilus galloprovincialis]|uniref:Uncharacterized protein n=1 Tax=Mytilus galloprovincialis TaxID=29158 RepID=A0A8B6BMD7_MYTGA|nr:Hypothetical predicted protein [Mytilus galloprovincialis]